MNWHSNKTQAEQLQEKIDALRMELDALKMMIMYHCDGVTIPKELGEVSPYYYKRLNETNTKAN